jgi:hypothetical protein
MHAEDADFILNYFSRVHPRLKFSLPAEFRRLESAFSGIFAYFFGF